MLTAAAQELASDHVDTAEMAVADALPRLPRVVRKDDLLSAAMLGLVKAADQFDPELGVPFGAYALIRCRGEMVDELRSMDWATRTQRGRLNIIHAAQEDLAWELGREPTGREIAAKAGISDGEFREADRWRPPARLDGSVGSALAGALPSPGGGPEQMMGRDETIRHLHAAILNLPDRLRTVVVALYFEDRSGDDLAAEMGVTGSRVSQLRHQALRTLRTALEPAD